MSIIEQCIKSNIIPAKNYENRVITIFNFKVCSHLDPVNVLYCILILSIYTIYVSGKLGPGGEHTLKLKMVMTLIIKC